MNITILPPGYAHGYAPSQWVDQFVRDVIPTGRGEYWTDKNYAATKSKAEWIRKQRLTQP